MVLPVWSLASLYIRFLHTQVLSTQSLPVHAQKYTVHHNKILNMYIVVWNCPKCIKVGLQQRDSLWIAKPNVARKGEKVAYLYFSTFQLFIWLTSSRSDKAFVLRLWCEPHEVKCPRFGNLKMPFQPSFGTLSKMCVRFTLHLFGSSFYAKPLTPQKKKP